MKGALAQLIAAGNGDSPIAVAHVRTLDRVSGRFDRWSGVTDLMFEVAGSGTVTGPSRRRRSASPRPPPAQGDEPEGMNNLRSLHASSARPHSEAEG